MHKKVQDLEQEIGRLKPEDLREIRRELNTLSRQLEDRGQFKASLNQTNPAPEARQVCPNDRFAVGIETQNSGIRVICDQAGWLSARTGKITGPATP
jgi:hypothetical protein